MGTPDDFFLHVTVIALDCNKRKAVENRKRLVRAYVASDIGA